MEVKVLQERIEKKKVEIEKLEKKIAKYEEKKTLEGYIRDEAKDWSSKPKEIKTIEDLAKARVAYFEQFDRKENLQENIDFFERGFKNHIEYCDREIKGVNYDLEEAKKTLEKYNNMLEVEIQKANSIDSLPQMFKDFRQQLIDRWDEWDISLRDDLRKAVDAYQKLPYGSQERKDARDEVIERYGYNYSEKYHVTDEQIHKENEKASRDIILDLMNRVSAKTGEITSFDELCLRSDNSGFLILNGFIKGKKGKAEVRSILAGGYNIQRLHVRVLVL